jgi:hypothetical protein
MPKQDNVSATPEPTKSIPQISIQAAPNLNIPVDSTVRVPLAVKTNQLPLSPRTNNIQKPSLETTCLSSSAPKRAIIKRTPSIRLSEGIGGKATVVFEETDLPSENSEPPSTKIVNKKRKPSTKTGRTKRVRRDDPGKENIPPVHVNLGVRRSTREPRSADLEEIALGLVALRGGR